MVQMAKDELNEHRAMLWRAIETEVYATAHPNVKFQCPQLTNIWGNPEIGDGTKIGAYTEIGNDVVVGRDCTIGAYTFIPPGTRIGDNVWIGPRVTFTNDKYPPSDPPIWRGIVVASNAVIGAGVTLLPGIVLDVRSRVGAGAVVTTNVLKDITVVGNPACELRPSECHNRKE